MIFCVPAARAQQTIRSCWGQEAKCIPDGAVVARTLNPSGDRAVTPTLGGVATATNFAMADAGAPSLGGTIAGKSGPANARVWVFGVGNNGPGLALNAEITGVTLLQASGPACSPVVATQFPLAVGNIPPQGVVQASVTINFTGCDSRAMFKVTAAESANSGAATGTIVRLNQFQ
jgi:hypothetical protein